jgi:hypothetical protein
MKCFYGVNEDDSQNIINSKLYLPNFAIMDVHRSRVLGEVDYYYFDEIKNTFRDC